MHILMTVNTAWNIWNFRKPIVESLLEDGYQVTVLAPPDSSVPNIIDLGCRFHPLEMNAKGMNPIEDLKLQNRLTRIFKESRPDIVLSYTIKNNLFGGLAARATGIPFVPNVTGLGTAFLSGRIIQSLSEVLYRNAFRGLPIVFFQNSDDRDLFVNLRLIQPGQARLLPGSGIDLERFSVTPMPDRTLPPIFLMIARLLRDKGVIEFVEAARIVKYSYPQVRFQLLGAVGSENRSAIDQRTVDRWIEEGTVEYLGTADDVRPAIQASSCVVLPSYREGAPRTLIEAAAMGRPVIATDAPGCRNVLDKDISGLLCEVRSTASLAAAMLRFLSLPVAMQHGMGLAGRAKMEKEYDQSIIVDAYREAIEALAGANRTEA